MGHLLVAGSVYWHAYTNTHAHFHLSQWEGPKAWSHHRCHQKSQNTWTKGAIWDGKFPSAAHWHMKVIWRIAAGWKDHQHSLKEISFVKLCQEVGNIPFLKKWKWWPGIRAHICCLYSYFFPPESWGVEGEKRRPWKRSPSSLTVDVMEDQRMSR